jgi:glycosyltransferase involved in cell wall biosynthesis
MDRLADSELGIMNSSYRHRPLTVSIVTPSLNQGRYLESAMRSVLQQDHSAMEYLVLDGGSHDSSRRTIERYATKLSYMAIGPDRGQADALRRGFERARGDILGWLNADDVLLPGAVRRVADFFARHPLVEAACGGAYYIGQDGRPLRRALGSYTLGVRASYDRLRYYAQDGVFQQATFFRRSAYDAVGGIDPQWQFIMDLDLFTRLARRKRFGRIPGMLACFRLHGECKSTTRQDVRQAELLRFRRRYGIERQSWCVRRGRYWLYRVPSLMRKVMLAGLRQGRLVKLHPVGTATDDVCHAAFDGKGAHDAT